MESRITWRLAAFFFAALLFLSTSPSSADISNEVSISSRPVRPVFAISAAKAKKSRVKRIKAQIAEVKQQIKTLKKQADRYLTVDNVIYARIMAEVAEHYLTLDRLKRLLRFGECNPSQTQLMMKFENNSKYSVGAYIGDGAGSFDLVKIVPPEKIKSIKISYAGVEKLVGDADSLPISFHTVVNNKDVFIYRYVPLKRVPSEPPCSATATFKLYDRSFPVPPSEYKVFGVHQGPNLYVGEEGVLKQRTPKSFLNGGNDNVNKVTYTPLSGSFTKWADAAQALCNGITQHVNWQMYAPCQQRYMFNGNWYWGCEPTVQEAIRDYCPKWNY